MTESSESVVLTFDRAAMKLSDGRDVIDIKENAGLVRHPHPSQEGRLVPALYVSQLFVDDGGDGLELFACEFPDVQCGKVFPRAQSVVSHMPSHGPSAGAPKYPVETIKRVIRYVKEAKRDRIRGYSTHVAQRLNDEGISTVGGDPWTAGGVSNIYNNYVDKYPVRLSGRPKGSKNAPKETFAASTTEASLPQHELANLLNEVRNRANDLIHLTDRMLVETSNLLSSSQISGELVEKAQKYDELMKILGK